VLPAPVLAPGPGRTRARGAGGDGYGASLPELAQGAARGFFNSVTDDDGVVRSLPVLSRHAGQYYESLALALYRVAQGRAVAGLTWAGMPGAGGGKVLEALLLQGAGGEPPQRVALDPAGTALVPFRGRGGPGGARTAMCRRSMCWRAAPRSRAARAHRARGLDLARPAGLARHARGADLSGVESHANLISGLLDQRLPVRPDYAVGYEALLLLVLGLLLAWRLPGPSAAATMLTSGVAVLVLTGLTSTCSWPMRWRCRWPARCCCACWPLRST
jgi:adenylate cyclase